MAHVSEFVRGTSCFRNRRLTSPGCCSRSRAWTKCKGWRPQERPNTFWIKCAYSTYSQLLNQNFSLNLLVMTILQWWWPESCEVRLWTELWKRPMKERNKQNRGRQKHPLRRQRVRVGGGEGRRQLVHGGWW
jgi:hypothetical protein